MTSLLYYTKINIKFFLQHLNAYDSVESECNELTVR